MTTITDLIRQREELLAALAEATTHNAKADLQETLNAVDREIDKINAQEMGT